MTPDRWQEIDRAWHAVLARPEDERAAAVAELCAGDDALRREVVSLLESLGQASAAGFGVAPGLHETRTTIFDGFLSLQGGAGAPLGAALTERRVGADDDLHADTDVDRPGTLGAINGINEMVLQSTLNVPNLIRLYTVSNMPHIDSDFVLSAVRPGSDFTDPARPRSLPGRRRSAQAADRRAARCAGAVGTRRIPPPPSLFNGDFLTGPDRIEFHRTSPSTTLFPLVDDVSLDTHVGLPNPAAPLTPAQRTAWVNVRNALGRQSARLRCPKRRAAAAGSTSSEQAQLAQR